MNKSIENYPNKWINGYKIFLKSDSWIKHMNIWTKTYQCKGIYKWKSSKWIIEWIKEIQINGGMNKRYLN